MGECICLMLAYIFLKVSDKPESRWMARAALYTAKARKSRPTNARSEVSKRNEMHFSAR